MILWNVAAKKIEARYDGRFFEFAPNERKRIDHPDIYNHLIFKLRGQGLVALEELNPSPEAEKKALTEGLKARWKTLDGVVRNYRTLNKERESKKLSAEAPSDAVIESAEEAGDLLEQLKELDGERYKKVDAYLTDDRAKNMAEEIKTNDNGVETKGSFETKLKGNRPGKSRSNAVSSPANP